MSPRLRFALSPAVLVVLLAVAGGARAADCVLDGNPQCGSAIHLGSVSGDAASATITRSGTGEGWFRVYVQETSSVHPRPLNARIVLQVPPDADYDLVVRCASCTSTAAQMSKKGAGQTESVNVTRTDTFADNSFWIFIEVRYYAGKGCGAWLLTVNGNTAATKGALACG